MRGMDSFVAFDEILKLAQANEVSARVRCWNTRGTLVERAPLGAVVFCRPCALMHLRLTGPVHALACVFVHALACVFIHALSCIFVHALSCVFVH